MPLAKLLLQLSQVPLLVTNNLHPRFCQAKKAQLQLPLKRHQFLLKLPLPVLPVAPSVAWTYDESYGAKYGNSFGVAALTGDDANENKALIAQYNKLLLAKGWAKATDSDFDDFDVIGLALYGTNVYCMDDTDSDKRLVAEIIPCADAEGDGLMTYAPMDPEGNEITSGIFIVVQTA